MMKYTRNSTMTALIILVALALVGPAIGQIGEADITIDGDLSEWDKYNPFTGNFHPDEFGDRRNADDITWEIDFWLLADANYLYFAGINGDPNPVAVHGDNPEAATWEESDLEYFFDPLNRKELGRPVDTYQLLFGPEGSFNDMGGNGGACIPADPWGIGTDGAIWEPGWESEVEHEAWEASPGYGIESRVSWDNLFIADDPIDPNALLGGLIGFNVTIMSQENGRRVVSWTNPYDGNGYNNTGDGNPDGIVTSLGSSHCTFLYASVSFDRVAIVGGTTTAVEPADKLATTWGDIKFQ